MTTLKTAVLSLTALKCFDFLFPLVLVPFAINIVGIEKYGEISFFQTISLFMLIIIDYGFNVSGIQKIATCKSEFLEGKYITASVIIKLILFIFSSLIYFILCLNSPASDNIVVILAFYCVVFSGVFNFQWYYQAKGRYKFILGVSLASRIVSFLLFFILVKDDDDVELVAIIFAMMYSIPAWIHLLERIVKLNFSVVSFKYIKLVFYSNWSIFSYRILNSGILPVYVYTLGFILSPAQLGALGIVQRVLGATINFSTPITQALIPHLAKIKSVDILHYQSAYKKYSFNLFLFSVFLLVTIPLFIYLIIKFNLISGGLIIDDLVYPMLMVLTIIPHVMNSLFSQNLVLLGKGNKVRNTVLSSFVIAIPLYLFSLCLLPEKIIIVYVITYYIMMFKLMRGVDK